MVASIQYLRPRDPVAWSRASDGSAVHQTVERYEALLEWQRGENDAHLRAMAAWLLVSMAVNAGLLVAIVWRAL